MRKYRSVVSRLVIVFVAFGLSAQLPSNSAGAELARGSVHIHSRVCDATATQLYRDCHDNPGPPCAMYTIDSRAPKAICGEGNVSFGRATAGDHLVKLTSGKPGEYGRMRAFCSNSTSATGPVEAIVVDGAVPQFWVRVGAGSRLTCDVYFIP